MCTSDGGVSSAELRSDVEGGRVATANDDVVCVGVVFAPIVLAAGGTCTWSQFSVYLAFGHETGSVRAIWICMYSHLIHGAHLYNTKYYIMCPSDVRSCTCTRLRCSGCS